MRGVAASWERVDGGSDGPIAWSEWRLTRAWQLARVADQARDRARLQNDPAQPGGLRCFLQTRSALHQAAYREAHDKKDWQASPQPDARFAAPQPTPRDPLLERPKRRLVDRIRALETDNDQLTQAAVRVALAQQEIEARNMELRAQVIAAQRNLQFILAEHDPRV